MTFKLLKVTCTKKFDPLKTFQPLTDIRIQKLIVFYPQRLANNIIYRINIFNKHVNGNIIQSN
jgi:hypothetical protein